MKTRSITRRVIAVVLMAELIAALVVSTLVFAHDRRTRLHALDTAMRGRCDSLLGAVQDAEDAGDHVYVDPAELRLPADDRWAVFNADGSMVGHSDNGAVLQGMRQHDDGISNDRIDGMSFRLLQRHALRIIDRDETAGVGLRRPVVLVYASPQAHLVHEALESASYSILVTMLVSAVTAAVVSVFLRHSLRPVTALSEAAAHLTLARLQFTPPPSVLGIAELRPLATTLSKVVERLRSSFEREQRFVGDAAHELKTAVAILRSTLQVMMLKSRTPDEYHAGLDRALEDTQRMELLVQQMLTLARVDEVREADGVCTDLSMVAEKVCLQLLPVSQLAGVVITCDPASLATVALSEDRAVILIRNLVLNAIQHSRPATTVSVRVSRSAQHVELCVQDQGEGVDADALPHVFERFYRADTSRARSTGGTGLGLAICKSIVDQVSGTLEITSVPHRGTTVLAIFSVA